MRRPLAISPLRSRWEKAWAGFAAKAVFWGEGKEAVGHFFVGVRAGVLLLYVFVLPPSKVPLEFDVVGR